jgi:polyisoprenyl-teichoic acid--peptidoglycan teichoic acid transferase
VPTLPAPATPRTAPAITRPRRHDPAWARVFLVIGVLLMLFSGTALIGAVIVNTRYGGAVNAGDLLPGGEKRSALNPNKSLNLLLSGIDARPESDEPVRSDSIILVHIPKGHDRAYLISLPRDLIVEIPASPPQRQRAGTDRLNAAFPYGADGGRGLEGGFQLMSRTISRLTGIEFDGAAVINFDGFRSVVAELGGVDMCLDHEIRSEHIGYDSKGKYRHPRDGGKPNVYPAGCQHLGAHEALDVVRQRKSLPDGDYGRQRNQQRFLKAILKQAKSKGVITDPRKADAVVRAAGKALTFDGKGISPVEWAWSLRNISESSLTMLKTPAKGVGVGDNYQGEELDPVGREMLRALADNRLEDFALAHPELINPG